MFPRSSSQMSRWFANGPSRTDRGSLFIMVMVFALVMSIVITFSIRAAQMDTQMSHRAFRVYQTMMVAEAGLERAKGDLLAQVAATNFLGNAFESIADKYSVINTRFNSSGSRVPTNATIDEAYWRQTATQNLAFWRFDTNTALNVPTIDDWAVQGEGVIGVPIVYVTRAVLDTDGDTATGAAGSFDATLTAVVEGFAGQQLRVQAVSSRSYRHQLSFPRLFDYLILGNQLSDCSMCHLKIWGDVGQVRADDPFQLHIQFDSTRFNRMTMWGQLHLAGNFDRVAFPGEGSVSGTNQRQERILNTPGRNGQFIYSRNGSTLATAWRNENPSAPASENPFRNVNTLTNPLPLTWPSVKDNLLDWFEPRVTASAQAGGSILRVPPRDNNITATYRPVTQGTNIPTQISIGAGASAYNRAIDRVATSTPNLGTRTDSAIANNSGVLNFDRGLHPADDLDDDSVPNGFDADLDGDGVPETPRASNDPNNPAFHLTNAALATNFVFSPESNRLEWRLGRQFNTTTRVWERVTTTPNYRTQVQNAITDQNLAHTYTRSGTTYTWAAAVTGIATSTRNSSGVVTRTAMENLIDNIQTGTGANTGRVEGVFPANTRLSDGNPDYTANSGNRDLVVMGSRRNPIEISGQVVVRGDLVITGSVSGVGSIISHRNIFVPTDLRYVNPPDWNDGSNMAGDQLGLVAGGNVLIGNIIQNTEGFNDLMEFVWGNMIDINSAHLTKATWNWGRDGTAGSGYNHMINPTYLMDGQDGGRWINGRWYVENAGNTVANVFNGQGMRVGGGLNTASSLFNSARRHINFTGNSNPNTTNDNTSHYRNYYISTPGLLPRGSGLINAMPTIPDPVPSPAPENLFGQFSGGFINSNDFKFITQLPLNQSGARVNDIGSERRNRWITDVEAVLYADYGVIGGTLPSGIDTFLEFKGTVIGKDVQILAARQGTANTDTKFTKDIGGLYYDGRLKNTINPLGFPFTEGFIGGEMAMSGVPPAVGGSRDSWIPVRLTDTYYTYFGIK